MGRASHPPPLCWSDHGRSSRTSHCRGKVAYRKMVLKFHPDKREDDVSEEEASLKFREIKRAFETIKKQLEAAGATVEVK